MDEGGIIRYEIGRDHLKTFGRQYHSNRRTGEVRALSLLGGIGDGEDGGSHLQLQGFSFVDLLIERLTRNQQSNKFSSCPARSVQLQIFSFADLLIKRPNRGS
jgi:hypothetical protein